MFQEIEAAVPEASKKDIGKAFKAIVAVLQSEEGVSLHCLASAMPLISQLLPSHSTLQTRVHLSYCVLDIVLWARDGA